MPGDRPGKVGKPFLYGLKARSTSASVTAAAEPARATAKSGSSFNITVRCIVISSSRSEFVAQRNENLVLFPGRTDRAGAKATQRLQATDPGRARIEILPGVRGIGRVRVARAAIVESPALIAVARLEVSADGELELVAEQSVDRGRHEQSARPEII